MNYRISLAALAAAMLLGGAAAYAQTVLKPMKDKESKKFGYVADDKGTWVIEPKFDRAGKFDGDAAIAGISDKYGIIDNKGEWLLEPAFDEIEDFRKNGLARLMSKDENGKLYGAADKSGTVVLPVEYNAVNIDKKYDVMSARKDMTVGSDTPYDDKRILMWGVYGIDGAELCSPQFSSSPSFSNGFAMVTSAITGLKGVIDLSGNFLVPVQNFSIDRNGARYKALTSDLVWVDYDENFNAASTQEIPGYVLPYDTYDDDVRAITYKRLRMGEKLHKNELKLAEMPTTKSLKGSDLPIDWGEGNSRFVRLGLVKDEANHEHSLVDVVSGKAYTVAAQLFEADGTLVQTISEWGWLEGVAAECIIYTAGESGEYWAVMTDINNTGIPSFASRMTNYKTLTASTVQGAFGLSSSDEKAMHSWTRMREKHQEILKTENLGILTYTYPEEYETEGAGFVAKVSNWPLLHRQFQIGEVYSCKPGRAKDGQVLAVMSSGLKMHFTDVFGKTGIKFDGDEEIYWGPGNARFIKLELIPVKTEKRKLASPEKADMIFDDTLHSGFAFKLAVCMYEEDGTFLRCLGESVKLGFAAGDMVLLEDLGLVFTGYRSRPVQQGQKISFTVPVKQASVLSSLRAIGAETPAKKEK